MSTKQKDMDSLENKLMAEDKPQPPKESKLYILYAFIACCGYGSANYFNGLLSMKQGVYGTLLVWLPFTVMWALFHLQLMAKNKKNKGQFFVKEESMHYDKEKGKWSWYGAFLMLLRSILAIYLIMMFYASQSAAAKSGINQGVVTALINVSAISNAFLFYFLFNEKLSVRHVIALFSFIFAVVLIAFGFDSSNEESISGEVSDQYQQLILALVLTVFLGMGYSISQLMYKYMQAYYKQDSLELALNIYATYFPYLFPLYIVYIIQGNTFTFEEYMLATAGAVLAMIGTIFNIKALMSGKGAIVYGIVNLAILVHTIFAAIFQGIIPTLLQFVGMLFALFGSTVILEVEKYIFPEKKNEVDAEAEVKV